MSFRTSTTLPDQLPPEPDARETQQPAKVVAKKALRSYAYPRENRVTRGADIEQVRKEGKRVRTASMEVRAIASLGVYGPRRAGPAALTAGDASTNASANATGVSTANVARVGVVVPRYGKSAVDRNRLKRRLRELVRIEVLPVLPVLDIVIKTAPRAYSRTFDELREEVRKWTHQLVTGRGAR